MLECEEHQSTHEHHHHHHHEVKNAKVTLIVIILTVVTMVAEISFGQITHSMALLADGWHMGTHAFALLLTFGAYILMEKFKDSDIFQSGTEKVSDLAGYTSAIFLGVTGISIIIEAVHRFINPIQISFTDAILVAIIGLIVNGVCLFIMEIGGKKEKDYNFKAAYLHIAADTLTSVLAIAALLLGKYIGLTFLDPAVGVLGGLLIIRWAYGLLKDTTKKLIEYKEII